MLQDQNSKTKTKIKTRSTRPRPRPALTSDWSCHKTTDQTTTLVQYCTDSIGPELWSETVVLWQDQI